MNKKYPPVSLFDTHTRMLSSSFVNDEYELLIWLPPGYDISEQNYPTLYILDSPYIFGTAIEAIRLTKMELDTFPDMIIVAPRKKINNMEEDDGRWRDYTPVPFPEKPGTGYAEGFLNFLEQECIPFMAANYRVHPDDRVIWGNSMGGLFALYVLFNKTHLFSRYIAGAPAFMIGETTFFNYEQALNVESLPCEAKLFVSVGALDRNFAPNAIAFMDALSDRKLPNLKFQTLVMEDLGHATAAAPAFYYGIQAVYNM